MAQGLNSAYFTKDYKFRHTMNPALANEQNYVSIPALGSINVNLRGNFGYQDVIMDNPMYPATSDKKMTTFMNPYISVADALDGFSSGRNRIVGDVSIMVLSAGFRAFGGYNTIELNSRTSFGMSLPYELFEFAKNTGNRTYDRATSMWALCLTLNWASDTRAKSTRNCGLAQSSSCCLALHVPT